MARHPFWDEIRRFKRDLLTLVLRSHGGNRTHTAKALGLQRTHLLRMIRDLDVQVPRPRKK